MDDTFVSSGLHVFGLNDNPQLYTDSVKPWESHPFMQGTNLPAYSHQDFSAKKTLCATDLRRTPLGEFNAGDNLKDWNGEVSASCDRQREIILEEQRNTLKKGDGATMKELFQPGDKSDGDAFWGVIREGRQPDTPHWSHWQFAMKKTHHAIPIHKTDPAANDVNVQSSAQSRHRHPKSWASPDGSRQESARNGSSERIPSRDGSGTAGSKKANYSSHAHLALAKRRHATHLDKSQAPVAQSVLEAMESPDYQYFSDRSKHLRPSSAQRTAYSTGTPDQMIGVAGGPGMTPYPSELMDDSSSAYGGRARFSAEIPLNPRVLGRKRSVPGYSTEQISRQHGIDLEPFYQRSLGVMPRGSPEINPTSLYKSHAEMSSHKTLCKTEIRHTPNWNSRPASTLHSAVDRRNSPNASNTEVRERRSKSADSLARGSTNRRQSRQMEARTPRQNTAKMSVGRADKTSSRRRASTADGTRR